MAEKIYGDEKTFHLNLYLEDNTIEVLYAGNRNGYDPFKALIVLRVALLSMDETKKEQLKKLKVRLMEMFLIALNGVFEIY